MLAAYYMGFESRTCISMCTCQGCRFGFTRIHGRLHIHCRASKYHWRVDRKHDWSVFARLKYFRKGHKRTHIPSNPEHRCWSTHYIYVRCTTDTGSCMTLRPVVGAKPGFVHVRHRRKAISTFHNVYVWRRTVREGLACYRLYQVCR